MRPLRALALAAALCCVPALAGAQSEPFGTMVFEYNGYNHITANGTTTISPARVLVSLCINTKGALSNTATLYDGDVATGNVIAVYDTTVTFGCVNYSVALVNGFATVVLATGTAADLTVTYR